MSALLTDVLSILKTTPARWAALTQSVAPELLITRPAPDEWSAAECLQHMIEVEQSYQYRLKAFLEGRDFPTFDPDQEDSPEKHALETRDLVRLAGEFSNLRQASLRALIDLFEADFERTARHPELGPVSLRQMLNTWAAHDLNHTMQAERAVMQPFIRACGPWVKFFTSQVIEG